MNQSEIAELSARVSITGLGAAQSGLAGFDRSLRNTARTADATAAQMSGAAGKTGAAWETANRRQSAAFAGLVRYSKLAVLGTGAATGAAVLYGVKLNASLESAQASFSTFLGSMKKAKAFTEELRSVSSKSPLKLTDYAQGAQLLLGFGVASKKVIPLLSAVNKAVVATGKSAPEMQQITRALGQIQAKGKASAEELMQLAEAGAPVNKILQKELGLTGEQVANIGDQGIKSGRVLSAIATGWNKQFGPAYKNAATTFNFQFASATKNAEQLLRLVTQPVFATLSKTVLPGVNAEFQKLVAVVDNPKLTGAQKWSKVGDWFDSALASLGDLANEAGPKLATAFQKAMPAISRAIEKLTPIFAEAMARLAVAAVPLAVVAGVNIAKGLVKGFFESDLLGKALIGGYLLSLTTKGVLLGQALSGGIATGLRSGQAAAAINSALGGSMLSSAGAGTTVAAKSMATSLIGGLVRVLPMVAGAYAIGDTLSSVISGDFKAAALKGSLGGIGAVIGTIVAPGIGTAIGGAIGVGIGSLISSLTDAGGNELARMVPTIAERVASSAKDMKRAIEGEISATSNLSRAASNVESARNRVAKATRAAKVAEIERDRVLSNHAANTAPAIQAEARYAQKKRDVVQATHAESNAERRHGVALSAAKTILRDTVTTEKARIGTLRVERQSILRKLDAENKLNPGSKLQLQLSNRLDKNGKALNDTHVKLARTLSRAAAQTGPAYAKVLSNISVKSATMRKALGTISKPVGTIKRDFLSLDGTFSHVGSSSDKGLGRAKKAGERYGTSTGNVSRRVNSNMRSMLPVQLNITSAMLENFRTSADAVTGYGPSQGKRRGGYAFAGGGLVPVRVSPGEMLIGPNGKASIVPGKPTARDSVSMALAPGTAVATFDGQARLAAGESLPSVMRSQAPHFAQGGIVAPRVLGGSPGANRTENRGLRALGGNMNSKLKKLREVFSAGVGEMDGHKVANWIIPILQWARSSGGWGGSVSSGFRSLAEQTVLWNNRASNPYPVAPPGTSNHEGSDYPRGAVDVSDYQSLIPAVDNPRGPAPGKLKWYGPGDSVHFSGTGHRRGGIVQRLGTGGVVRQMTDALLRRGYSAKATAGIVGNAYRESRWNPAAVGTGGGGLFGFTTGEISLASLKAAAAQKGVDWTDVDFQVGFMDAHMDADLKARLNASGSVAGATQLFMDEWERPGIPAYGDRLWGANVAMKALNERRDAKVQKAKKQLGNVRRLWKKVKRKGTTKSGKKRATLAGQNARGAVKAARNYNFAGATEQAGKSRKFTRKAYRDIHKRQLQKRRGLSGKPLGNGAGNNGGGGGGNNGSAGSFDPTKPFGPNNFPGSALLPAGTLDRLRGPDMTFDSRSSVLDIAEATALATAGKKDDAAVYGARIKLESARRKRNIAKVKKLNKAIGKNGKAKIKTLSGKIKGLSGRERDLEAILADPKASKASKEKASKDLRTLRNDRSRWEKAKSAISGNIAQRDTSLANIADSTNAINSAKDSLTGLNDTSGDTGSASDLADEIKSLREAIEAQNKIATATQSVAGGEIGRAVKDWLSGELVGRGVGFSGGANNNVRY